MSNPEALGALSLGDRRLKQRRVSWPAPPQKARDLGSRARKPIPAPLIVGPNSEDHVLNGARFQLSARLPPPHGAWRFLSDLLSAEERTMSGGLVR